MGKYKNVSMLVAAIILAAFVTLLVSNQITKAKRGVKEETVELSVAKVDLKGGTVLTKEMIDRGKFLKKSVPTQCFFTIDELAGRVVVTPIAANFPICESNLAPITLKTGGVSAIVSTEKRAMAVKVDKIIGVSGFIHPNNRVDVLVTFRNIGGGFNFPITKTILENILVLAVGPDIEQKGKEEKPSPVDVITLEVTPQEAEKLALASQEGKLNLTLRKYGEAIDVATTGQTIPILLGSYSSGGTQAPKKELVKTDTKFVAKQKTAKPVETAKKEVPKPKPYIVELIKGTKVSESKFDEGSL